MPYSYVKYTGDGSTKVYAFNFPYISQEDVKVFLNETPTAAFTFLSANTIELNLAPEQGVWVEIRRETAKAERLVDFTDGSVLTEKDLDLANAQAFYLTQEAWDRSDVVIARANLSIDAAAQAKAYAEYAYKYERLANDHKDNALDADDRAKAYKEIAGTFAEATKTAATTIDADRAEVSANTDIVLTAKTDVLIAKGVVESQAQLANAILLDAQAAAVQAQTVANNALGTANAAAETANSLNATITQVAAQQTEALAARDGAVTAKTQAETAATNAASSATSAQDSATAAASSATSASTHSAAAISAKTQAETAQSAAVNAKTAAETAKTQAETAATQAVAASDGKADITYVDAQLATKMDAATLAPVATTGSYTSLTDKPTLSAVASTGAYSDLSGRPTFATVATSGSYNDLLNKPTIPTNTNQLTNGAGFATVTGTENLTNKTMVNAKITDYVETVVTPASAATYTIATANGTIHKLGINQATTIVLPASVAGKSYTLIVAYNGAFGVTFTGGGTLKWAGGSAPTATSVSGKFDIYVFTCDGVNTYGRTGGSNY